MTGVQTCALPILPTNSVNLSGSGTDADGTIAGYVWTKISGPSFYTIANNLKSSTTVSNLVQGVYVFELKVTDNNGASDMDTIRVTVNAEVKINIPPVANAGNDKTIVLPVNTVLINGSGTDVDGTITGYTWKQISGPIFSGLVSPNSAITWTNTLVAGTYEFELTVTDDMGATGKDTVFVAVDVPRLNVSIQSNSIKIYPNPVIDIATLEINTIDANSKFLVVISNIQGQSVYKNEYTTIQNYIKAKIDMFNLVKGIYTATIYFSNKEKQTLKFVKLN